jgi:acetyltransferase-like isoleucine patch superfamily enzyme
MFENLFFDKNDLKYCGKNVIIGKTVRIRDPSKVSIGDNVIIDDYTYISGNVNIGDYVHIAPSCVLSGSTGLIEMQPFSGLSAGCKVYGGSSNYLKVGLDIPTIPKELQYNLIIDNTILESFALIGANSIVLPGCILPQGLAVAAAVTVKKNFKLKPWHCLIDNDGKMLPRRGVEELKSRIKDFYPIEIRYE